MHWKCDIKWKYCTIRSKSSICLPQYTLLFLIVCESKSAWIPDHSYFHSSITTPPCKAKIHICSLVSKQIRHFAFTQQYGMTISWSRTPFNLRGPIWWMKVATHVLHHMGRLWPSKERFWGKYKSRNDSLFFCPANKRRWTNAGLMLVHRLRRSTWSRSGPLFSYKLRYIVGFRLVEMGTSQYYYWSPVSTPRWPNVDTASQTLGQN